METIMHRIRLIHWKAEEAEEKIAKLRAAGYEVDYGETTPEALRDCLKNPPAAFVIDLSRQPMQGRDIAIALRIHKTTRQAPLVFVEGEPEKVERVKTHLPDAVYTTWSRIRGSLKAATPIPRAAPSCPKPIPRGIPASPCPRNLATR